MYPSLLATLATPGGFGLGALLLVLALALAVRAFTAPLAEAPSMVSRMRQLSADALRSFGIEPKPGWRYRKHRIFDNKQIAVTDGATLQFFNNAATSSRTGHAKRAAGCSLAEPGIVDRDTENTLLALYLKLTDVHGKTAITTVTDVNKFLEQAVLDRLTVNGVALFENMKLDEFGRNLGFTPVLTGALATAQVDGIAVGQPGFADLGYVLDPFERSVLVGGQKIDAVISRTSGGALAVVLDVELGMVVIRGEPGQSNL